MKHLRVLLTALLAGAFLAMYGCSSSDGGVGGTGISSATLQGNVQDVHASQITEGTGLAAGFGGVWVGIQGTDISDVTDANGDFVLSGPIAGDRVVEFQAQSTTPSAQAAVAPSTLDVTLLAGSVTTLKDVVLSPGEATVSETQVETPTLSLDGDASCTPTGGTLMVTTADGTVVTVEITADTMIQRVSGTTSSPLACTDLTDGSEINVHGLLEAQHTILALEINRTKSGKPKPE